MIFVIVFYTELQPFSCSERTRHFIHSDAKDLRHCVNIGSPGMLTPSFNAVHGLASPLATSYANSPVTSMPLGFTLPGGSLATGTLRLPGQMTGQTCVLLVSNLNEEYTS
ncbi:polypyrimidine tract-binding protein 2 isoform X7 [Aphis craccivora]|uniref:Polypyrimidine tract-binding protein 2 isoform X7 n=1 Tax=Aphis craccivora TaxID=307492 RepID=A0A6G0ZQI2_APHCR|nr:polypyrimidine tract-binding protein 2 isoform X7 [Aphis craccivora]